MAALLVGRSTVETIEEDNDECDEPLVQWAQDPASNISPFYQALQYESSRQRWLKRRSGPSRKFKTPQARAPKVGTRA